MALQKAVKLESHEIENVLGYLDELKQVALIKLHKNHSLVKSTGQNKIAAFVGKQSAYLDLIEGLPDNKYLGKFVVV